MVDSATSSVKATSRRSTSSSSKPELDFEEEEELSGSVRMVEGLLVLELE